MKSFYWLCSSCAFGLSVWFLRAVAITLQCLIEHRKTILSQVIAANIREGEILTSQWKHNENIRNLIIEKAREKTRTTESRWGSFFNWFRRWHELCANERGRQINFSNNFFLILVSYRMPNQIRQLNFNDTFLDFEHLKSCFPQYTVKVRLCSLNCDSLFYHSAQRFIVKTKQNILALFYFQCSTDDPAERVPPFK